MSLKRIKIFFIKNLLIITVLFPLIIIFFYGFFLSAALKYKHNVYIKRELTRYEDELTSKHKAFLQEKAKYIELFMNFLYNQNLQNHTENFEYKLLTFIESLKKYDSGFIFIFKKDGTLIKHPCATKLVEFDKKMTIVDKFIEAAKTKKIAYYQGTDCIEKQFVKKMAYIHHIKGSDLYIVISKNEKDILFSIREKRKIWQQKLNDELNENIRLLLAVSFISIIFSLIFSKFINILLKDYEKQLKENNRVMFTQSRLAQAGELLSMISHQWRQPISKIASIASSLRFQIMMNQEINAKELNSKLEIIEEHTEFLSETIDDFKNFYKPKQKKNNVLILPIILKAIGFLENEIKKKDIYISKKFQKDRVVSLYPNELMQVIINILQNAIEFSKNHSAIIISTEITRREYIICITDHAGGIKDEHINKIFDAHFSTKVNGKNSTNLGLGLYVSKVIIEQHFNGKLEVQSKNKSSIFTIRLML